MWDFTAKSNGSFYCQPRQTSRVYNLKVLAKKIISTIKWKIETKNNFCRAVLRVSFRFETVRVLLRSTIGLNVCHILSHMLAYLLVRSSLMPYAVCSAVWAHANYNELLQIAAIDFAHAILIRWHFRIISADLHKVRYKCQRELNLCAIDNLS